MSSSIFSGMLCLPFLVPHAVILEKEAFFNFIDYDITEVSIASYNRNWLRMNIGALVKKKAGDCLIPCKNGME